MRKNTMGSLMWIRLFRLTNQSNQMSNECLKRFDLTTAQFDALIQIQAYQPLTQTELAEKAVITQGGISRMLLRLEKDGYIERRQDWKIKMIRFTKKGEEKQEEAMPQRLGIHSHTYK